MAQQQDSQERTEQATPKRRQEARKKGDVPRSRELNTTAIMLTGSGMLLLLGPQLSLGIRRIMREGLSYRRIEAFDATFMAEKLGETILAALTLLAPIFIACVAAALLTPILLGGWSFSLQAIAVKLDKLNPVAGLKRLFALRNLLELAKALAKFLVVAVAAVLMLHWMAEDLLALGRQPVRVALAQAASLCGWSLLALSATLAIIAAIDVPFQLWDYSRRLKMTRQEIRDEAKDTEGRPEVKSRIRSLQQQVSRRRMMEEVPRADVIVTNPTHYAVALRYDESTMRAPRVVAKGADLVAANIRKVALSHNVPLFEAPPLARALYAQTELDQDIPVDLYLAVAQVLTYVYQLRQAASRNAPTPAPPQITLPQGAAE